MSWLKTSPISNWDNIDHATQEKYQAETNCSLSKKERKSLKKQRRIFVTIVFWESERPQTILPGGTNPIM
jgi:hypothetical protein